MKSNPSHRIPREARKVTALEPMEDRKLFAAGALDASFNFNGFNNAPFTPGTTAIAYDMAVQPDGKTVVVGEISTPGAGDAFQGFAIARFNVDGSLDRSFSDDGMTSVYPGDGGAAASAVVIQPDGKIVVGGDALIEEILGFDELDMFLVRLNPNGSLDRSFGTDGQATARFEGTSLWDIALQRDGKIVAVGHEFTNAILKNDVAVARFHSNGRLDGSFDFDGRRTIGFGVNGPQAKVVTIDYSGTASTNSNFGKIIIGGNRITDRRQAIFARLNLNGSLDKSFDGDGLAIRTLPGNRPMTVSSLLVQPNGKLVFTGKGGADTDTFFATGRLNANGSLDTTFGPSQNGYVETNLGAKARSDSIMRNLDGSLLVAGARADKFAVVKYDANGIIDKSFDSDGVVVTNLGTTTANGVSIAQGPGRRFVLSGGSQFTTARFLDTGANVVTVGTFNPQLHEEGLRGSNFIVAQSERLPYATRVYFSIGGSARHQLPGSTTYDFTTVGFQYASPLGNLNFVDIPAGQSFVTVTLKPVDDTRVEGTETATFRILPNAHYEPDANSSVSVLINDSDSRVVKSQADGYVRDGVNAGVNFGAVNNLQVKAGTAGSGNNCLTYLKFDLSSITSTNNIKLKLFGSLGSNGSVAVNVYGASNNWTESTLTFNNKPALTTSPLAGTTIFSTSPFDTFFDVTNYLRAEKAAGRNTATLVLKANTATDQHVNIASRETDNGPMLVVT